MYSCGPSQGWARVGRLARTYLQQLSIDIGYWMEDLPRAIDNWDKWRERIRTIHASGMSWWWWFFFLLESFSHQCWLMVFNWSLNDSKSLLVSRILLSILTNLNCEFGCAPFIFLYPSPPLPFNNPLVTVPRAPIIIDINVTFMFNSFFNSLARSRYLSFFSFSFNCILWSAGTAKSTILQVLFFFCCWSL